MEELKKYPNHPDEKLGNLCSCKMVNIFKQQLTTKPDRKEFTNNLDPNDATKTHQHVRIITEIKIFSINNQACKGPQKVKVTNTNNCIRNKTA